MDALDGSVVAGQAHIGALLQGAVVDAQQREPPQEGRSIQVGDMRLQRHVLVVAGAGDTTQDRLKERFEVLGGQLAVARVFQGALAGLSGGVDDGDVHEGVHINVDAFVHEVLAEREQQVGRLRDNLVDTRVGTINLVDDNDDGQVCLEGLTQHEAGLRQRTFGGVDHEDHAIDHGQAALDLPAKVSVSGGVDHVDGDASSQAEGLRGGAAIVDGGVLSENRDSLFSLEISGVHDTFTGLFNRVAFRERS